MKLTASILTILTASALTSTALAADPFLPPPVEEIYVEEDYNWSGVYVGINGGYGGETFAHPFALYEYPDIVALNIGPQDADLPPGAVAVLEGSADVTAGGFVGGGQIGFNHQFDNIVVGIEADAQWTNITGAVNIYGTDIGGFIGNPGDSLDIYAGTTVDWFATIRPRLGFAHDRFLVYVTGGLAYGQVTSEYSITGTDDAGGELFEPIEDSITTDRWGYTIGGGVEYALTDNVTLKTEYLYTDLGQEQLLNVDLGGGGIAIDSWVGFHTVRAGLNLKF